VIAAEPNRSGGAEHAAPAPRPPRRIGFLLACGASAVALAGTLVSSLWGIMVVAPVVGVLAAGLVAIENLDFPRDPSARHMVFLAGCGGALLVPLVHGIAWLGVLGVPVMLVGVCVGVLAGVLLDPEGQGDASPVGQAEASGRA
jgi:hypothetical protein